MTKKSAVVKVRHAYDNLVDILEYTESLDDESVEAVKADKLIRKALESLTALRGMLAE